MVEIERVAIVPYTAEQMYDLVNDLAHYSDFLPWCNKVEIIETTDNSVTATVHFSKLGIHHSFTTFNTLTPVEKIESQLIKGPFKHLNSVWRFEEFSGGTKIYYNVSFEFSSLTLAKMLNPLFNSITSTIMESFCNRAREVYD